MREAEKVWARLSERAASIVCPICRREEWQAFGGLSNLRIVLTAATRTELVKVTGEIGGMPAYPFVCGNCGFIRLHSTEVLGEVAPEGE